jgi:excisionase family DNA binding protein
MIQTEQRTDNMEIYLSTNDLMKMLGVSRSTIYRLMSQGLPTLKIRALNRFPHYQVLNWLKEA